VPGVADVAVIPVRPCLRPPWPHSATVSPPAGGGLRRPGPPVAPQGRRSLRVSSSWRCPGPAKPAVPSCRLRLTAAASAAGRVGGGTPVRWPRQRLAQNGRTACGVSAAACRRRPPPSSPPPPVRPVRRSPDRPSSGTGEGPADGGRRPCGRPEPGQGAPVGPVGADPGGDQRVGAALAPARRVAPPGQPRMGGRGGNRRGLRRGG